MNYIRRSLESVVDSVTQEYPVVLLTGPRQVGKTTMLKKLMEGTERGYVSLDDLTERALAKNDPELFLQLHKPPLLIDEVQYAPELFPYIKILADREHTPGTFWLTGSQIFRLMRRVSESLAGRAAVLSMTSLSQAEICGAQMEPFRIDLESLQKRARQRKAADVGEIYERIYRGSMPTVVSGAISSGNIFYSSYISTYIERDVKELSESIDSLRFLRFVTAVAARCGQLLNIADIARDADINQKQAKLSRDGVNYIIRKYVHEIQRKDSSFPEIHAHGFRHSKAMHMLEAGINIVYIRDFLGHEDISTTMVYIRADNRLKTEAVNKLAPKVTGETEFPDWTKDTDLMSFLNSFK